jgi:hypothetical protein
MDSMSFIVGVKLSAALAGVTSALEIRITLAATDTHERTSNSRIGLFMMPPLVMCGRDVSISKLQWNPDTHLASRARYQRAKQALSSSPPQRGSDYV